MIKPSAFILVMISLTANELHATQDNSSRGDWIKYDNGTPGWFYWEHQYRGVWFNIADFIPAAGGMDLEETELWFYHHASFPWDTSETYVEFWNGTSSGPADFLEQLNLTALHCAPVFLDHSPDWITVEVQFWIIQNTLLSSGGWPSIIADNSNQGFVHSMVSPDMSIWEPLTTPYSPAGSEFFVSTFIEYPWAHGAELKPESWGSLKTLFY